MSVTDGNWEDYDTGPYCRHWNPSPSDCEEPCVCGHPCRRHYFGECTEQGCECEHFRDAEEEAAP